ncbi:MAG: NAD-dependent epimerase/dehydratase family protein, partial [Bacteroidetes bacterium]|nr:NAD-dependent epimerase/dehydratase family protein [Bacteroidota bacterium]
MKVLVTGGGGFIGMALIKRLIKEGHKVTSFSRREYPLHWALGISSIQADVRDLDALEKACKGKDMVFHLAAKVGIWGDYKEYQTINEIGTFNVIKACRKEGVGRIVSTSASCVVFDGSDLEGIDESYPYPETHGSHYASTKAMAERLILEANSEELKTISLRPHLVWGPYDTHLIPGILNRVGSGKMRRIGDKEHFIDTTYIDNMVDALVLAAEALKSNPKAAGKALFITNGEPARVWDFINSIIQIAGHPPIRRKIPDRLALFAAGISEWIHRLLKIKSEPFMTRYAIREMITNHWYDISAAREILGYEP